MADAETREPPAVETRFHASRGILLTQGLRFTVRLATAATLARLVTPADYGVFGMAAVVHGLAYVVQDFGLATVTLRAPDVSEAERTALFWLNLAIAVGVGAVVAAVGPAVAAFFGEPQLRWLVPVLAVTLVCNGLHAQLRAQLGRDHRFAELNRIEIAAFVLSSTGAIVAAALGAGVWALALLPLLAEITIAAGVWLTQPWRPGPWPPSFSVRAALHLGAGVSGHEVLRYFQRTADQLFIGRWFGSGTLGLYGRSAQLIAFPLLYVIDPLATWAIATLGRARADRAEARAYWRRLLNGLLHLTLPLAALLFCLPREVLRLAYGPNWTDAAPVLRGLALALVAQPLIAAVTWLLIAEGRGRRLMAWSATLLGSVVAACLCARTAGAPAIALAIGGALAGTGVVTALVVLRGLAASPTDLLAAAVRPVAIGIIAASGATAALARLPDLDTALRLGLGAAIIALCWAVAAIGRGTRQELSRHFLWRRS